MTPRKIIYVCGPYSAPEGLEPWEQRRYVHANVNRAAYWTKQLIDAGYAVICPHTMFAPLDGQVDYEQIMQCCLALVPHADAMYLLPQWRSSTGSRREVAEAVRLGVPQYEQVHELKAALPPDDA